MSPALTRDQALDLLPLYVLGALEPGDAQSLEAYLQSHPDFLAQLRSAEDVAAFLPHAAPEASLPRDAKRRLMTRISADLARPATAEAVPPRKRARDRGWRAGLARWTAQAAGALVVLVLIGLYAVRLQAQLNQTSAELATMRQAVGAIQQHLGVIASADRIVRLLGTEEAPTAGGNLHISGDKGVMVLLGLAPLPETQSYQLWLVVEGQPRSAGLFAAKPDAATVVDILVSPDAQTFTAVEVTVEPAGGSPTLQGPVVLRGQGD